MGKSHVNGPLIVTGTNLTTIADATKTIVADDHSGLDHTVVLNRAAGVTCTLPAATGSGKKYRFILAVDASGNQIVKVANATDVMVGQALILQDAADTVVGFETAATTDTVTLNGTTTGGKAGDIIEVIDIASGKWAVQVTAKGTGTEATPFSATVS